jgi:lysophospholipase L1-like esterase
LRVTRTASLWVASGVLLAVAGRAVQRLGESARLARRSTPFSIHPANANASMLIVGDSTAVGTGAPTPDSSLAGQLARAHRHLAIVNLAVNGARFEDVNGQLSSAAAKRFDVVLIQAGGNDVIQLTGEAHLRADVRRALARAGALAPLVIVMPAGNVGNAPLFFPPLSWWMTARSQTLHRVVREEAAHTGACYVNLYKPKSEDPFVRDPRHLHAADGLHPSAMGYALWLAELNEQCPLPAALRVAA